jgi:Uma2 family endonuclease
MALPQTRLVTADEFERFIALPEHRDRNYELIDGVIVEKAMPTDRHALVAGALIFVLTLYAREHGFGRPGPELRIRLPDHLRNTRQPDVSMILDPTIPIIERGPMQVMPDVIAEVKSPDDHYEDLRDKARYYIANGARLVWLLFPEKRIAEVYRPNEPSDILTLNDALDGFDVLPGFSVSLHEVFMDTRAG